MTNKAKTGPGTITIEGETYATRTIDYEGSQYTIRELSVDEGDDIWEASQEPVDIKNPTGPTRVNGRLNTRLLLAKALVEPTQTAEQVGKWGSRKYTTILRVFNEVNTISESNPTNPAGSAGPTSPDGGESSPTT